MGGIWRVDDSNPASNVSGGNSPTLLSPQCSKAQMFEEMAVLVDAQGEMLDAIEVWMWNMFLWGGKKKRESWLLE